MNHRLELRDKLLDAFIQYQYTLENPFPLPVKTQQELEVKYLSDSIFKNKVNSLVAGVMHIADEHIKEG